MANYDFKCPECGGDQTVTCGMNDDAKRRDVHCPSCGAKMLRVFHAPNTIIKTRLGSAMKLSKNQAVVNVDGRPVRMNFIDHGDRSGLDKGSLASRYPGARIDEKTGRPVMDVVSDIRDPLGAIERAKRRGNVDIKKKNIGQRYKLRKGAAR